MTTTPARPGTVRDPGLQPERTALAWVRTALSQTAVGLAFVRWLADDAGSVVVVTLAALVALVAGISPFAYRHLGRHLRLLEVGRARSAPEAVLATALVVVALAVLGVVAVLT